MANTYPNFIFMRFLRIHFVVAFAFIGVLSTGMVDNAQAQTKASTALIDEITVTARKRASVEDAQSVPVAVTAFGEDQLRALGFDGFSDISFSIPNTSLDEIGTSRGSASFAIRGVSATSSIVTIDPAVAAFMDGVYLPANAGTVMDMFDVEAIEILRGPQGTLFGRNVTGGAVSIRTKRPSQEVQQEAIYRYEGGGNNPTHVMGMAFQAPMTDTVSTRLALYYNEDKGWFKNEAVALDPTINNGDDTAGSNKTVLFRPSILWEPNDDLNVWLKYEHIEIEGQQPPPQNNGNFFGKKEDRISIDFLRPGEMTLDALTLEVNYDMGMGTLTNLFGWRDYKSLAGNDIDATRFYRFHSYGGNNIESYQNELRYSGTLDRLDFTAGLFLYESEIKGYEARDLKILNLWTEGGGFQETSSWALFTENEYHLDNDLSVIFGLRYTEEEKDVKFTEVNSQQNCGGETRNKNLYVLPNCRATSTDGEKWDSLGGKLGIEYQLADNQLFYAQFTRGFRSGGFNIRDTLTDGTNAPAYDEEQLDSFEIGLKADWLDGRARTNFALFMNEVEGLQRDVNLPSRGQGIIQSTANTANADINGYEIEALFSPMEDLLLSGSVGYIDAEYTAVFYDLNGDGVVNAADLNSTLPRVPELTYSLSVTYDRQIEMGLLTARLSYDHRDKAYFTDANDTPLNEADIINARLSLQVMDGAVELALFGKNLDNNIMQGGSSRVSTNRPDPHFGVTQLGYDIADSNGPNGTFSPIANKGRVFGFEVNARF